MGKKKGTPDELDWLFERDIIDEEDYVDFWSTYWKRNKQGKKELVDDYIAMASDIPPEQTQLKLAGVITKNKSDATKQAKAIGGYIIRRNAKGQFSKRGRFYQVIKRRKK